jgi:hypothetical protein
VVLVLEECSLEVPLGQLLLELDDDDCSVVVVAGATTTGAGAITIGAGYTTTGGFGDTVVVSLVVVSVLPANAIDTLPHNVAIPRDKTTIFNRFFTMISP